MYAQQYERIVVLLAEIRDLLKTGQPESRHYGAKCVPVPDPITGEPLHAYECTDNTQKSHYGASPVPYGCDGDPCTIPHHHPDPDPQHKSDSGVPDDSCGASHHG